MDVVQTVLPPCIIEQTDLALSVELFSSPSFEGEERLVCCGYTFGWPQRHSFGHGHCVHIDSNSHNELRVV